SLPDALFYLDQASLVTEAKESLNRLADNLLNAVDHYCIEIEGHIDAAGSEEYNRKLSEERAASVRDHLMQVGLPADRITSVRGMGHTKPIATNNTLIGRYINRRVEIIITEPETPPPSSLR